MSPEAELNQRTVRLREHALAIAAAGVRAADAGLCVARAMPSLEPVIAGAAAWHVIAAGKAAGPMLRECLAGAARTPATAMAVAPGGLDQLPPYVRTFAGGHPVPNAESVAAGRCALGVAAGAGAADTVIVLVSGGASALLVLPVEGVSLPDKRATTARLLMAGADIGALNTVRKHLSQLKGGRLAAASRARVIALAVSDVVGDDPSVIGSGVAAGDPTSFADALRLLDRFGGREAYPPAVVDALKAGTEGRHPESPPPGSPALARAATVIVGSREDAMAGAENEARRMGYRTHRVAAPVVGEAREAAVAYAGMIGELAGAGGSPVCIVSSGETTVQVTGGGTGGRNQEFALALVDSLPPIGFQVVVASVGTDGVDGPTDAAGAIVASDTAARARAQHLDPRAFLADNDAYHFFEALGDLIKSGPTRTNVGDLQVAIVADGLGLETP